MKRFIEGEERSQVTLLPECLDDYIADDNPVRVVDVFVDELKLHQLGFDGVKPAATGRPSYHPAVLLKIYIYGYFKQVRSSRCLEREAQRNVELMWLTDRLTPAASDQEPWHRDADRGDESVGRNARRAAAFAIATSLPPSRCNRYRVSGRAPKLFTHSLSLKQPSVRQLRSINARPRRFRCASTLR